MDTTWRGYLVSSAGGRVGTAEGIVPNGDASDALLAVRIGRNGSRVLFFPLDQVGWVDARRRVVVMNGLSAVA